MEQQQITTISLFRFSKLAARWWAFRQMAFAPAVLSKAEGLIFGKVLGSGAGNGFSPWPNWGVYALLGVWENEAAARHFMAQHPLFEAYTLRSNSHYSVFLRTVKAHGAWDGQSPFVPGTTIEEHAPMAVLTRATIYARHLWRFWRYVPPVSRSIENREGLLLSIGIGELPWIQQATFSLWRSSAHMNAYAYQSHYHSEVVKKTRQLGWYKEELFARFVPFDTEGSWNGENPLGLLSH